MQIFDKQLSKITSLSDRLKITSGDIVQFVGCGGKTSLINVIANELSGNHECMRCAIITTTKRWLPNNDKFIINKNQQLIIPENTNGCIEVGCLTKDNKYCWLGDDNYSSLKKWADVILVEADGSKQLPIKATAHYEPAYLNDASKTIVVMGMSAYEKNIKDVCHRYGVFCSDLKNRIDYCQNDELKKSLLEISNSKTVTKKTYKYLLNTYYLSNSLKNTAVILNQADNNYLQNAGSVILDSMNLDGLVTSVADAV